MVRSASFDRESCWDGARSIIESRGGDGLAGGARAARYARVEVW